MQTEQVKSTLNYNVHDYGNVLRSSAIFYFKKTPSFKTTVSLLNYWKIKRDLKTTIVASVRKMDGTLVLRENFEFNESYVINYTPNIMEESFEGSLEIELFSLQDMVIPYAGITVVYESKFGISMVHSYGRAYSQHEIEEGKVVKKGEEACCHGLIDSDELESFGIVHNGSLKCPSQLVTVSVLNHRGDRENVSFTLHELNPYETLKVSPKKYFPNLIKFLEGKPGYSTFSFHLNNSAFTRMLSVNQKKDSTDFQVTHSNFNFSKNGTSTVKNENYGYLMFPKIQNTEQEFIVYPDCAPGKYELIDNADKIVQFNENKGVVIPMKDNDDGLFTFKRLDGEIPSRIHTGIKVSKSPDVIATDSCVGIFTKEQPKKRFTWALCSSNSKIKSRVFVTQMDLGDLDKKKLPVIITLYSDHSLDSKEISIDPKILSNGMYISEIFPDAENFLGSGYGWITIFSEHPYYVAYTTLENKHDSISFEHGI